jgi:hypothetical protein
VRDVLVFAQSLDFDTDDAARTIPHGRRTGACVSTRTPASSAPRSGGNRYRRWSPPYVGRPRGIGFAMSRNFPCPSSRGNTLGRVRDALLVAPGTEAHTVLRAIRCRRYCCRRNGAASRDAPAFPRMRDSDTSRRPSRRNPPRRCRVHRRRHLRSSLRRPLEAIHDGTLLQRPASSSRNAGAPNRPRRRRFNCPRRASTLELEGDSAAVNSVPHAHCDSRARRRVYY